MLEAFRARDLLVLLILVVAMIHSWFQMIHHDYLFEPIWFIETDYVDISPIIFDFHGMGKSEMICIIKSSDNSENLDDDFLKRDSQAKSAALGNIDEYWLQVLDVGPNSDESSFSSRSQVYHPEIILSTKLSTQSSLPVALAAGFISSGGIGGVAAVAFDNLTISVFKRESSLDNQYGIMRSGLGTLWSRDLSALLSGSEAGAGCIRIVRIMISQVYDDKFQKSEEYLDDPLLIISVSHHAPERMEEEIFGGRVCPDEITLLSLQLVSGAIQWMYSPPQNLHDFSIDSQTQSHDSSLAQALPPHALSGSIISALLSRESVASSSHLGSAHIASTSYFKTSLLQQLPHFWNFPSDESLSLQAFHRRSLGSVTRSRKRKPAPLKSQSSRSKSSILKLTLSHSSNNSQKLNVNANPIMPSNAAVLHHRGGILAVALLTGAPLGSLALPHGQVFGDIDEDHGIDSVRFFTKEKADSYDCPILQVQSGLPPTYLLFNSSSLCGEVKFSHKQKKRWRTRETASKERSKDDSFFFSPLIIPSFGCNGVHDCDSSKNSNFDAVRIITLSKRGTLTALSSRGRIIWQTAISNDLDATAESSDFNIKSPLQLFHPLSASLQHYSSEDEEAASVLITSRLSISLLSLKTGAIRTEIELPSPSMANPIIADFDGDGKRDIIARTNAAIVGYQLITRPSLYPLFIPLILCAIIAAGLWTCKLKMEGDEDGIDRASGSTRRSGGWFASLRSTRATDYLHLD